MQKSQPHRLLAAVLIVPMVLCSAMFLAGCANANPPDAPTSFSGSPSGWNIIELRPEIVGNYEKTWQVTVDAIAQDWTIETLDKDSGYLRTGYKQTAKSVAYYVGFTRFHWTTVYSHRLSVKFPTGDPKTQINVKTETKWFNGRDTFDGWDGEEHKNIIAVLQGRLGRVVK